MTAVRRMARILRTFRSSLRRERRITLRASVKCSLMLRTDGFIPFAAPSTGAFAEKSPKGRGREAARCQRDRSPFWQPSANTHKGHKSEEHRKRAATGRPADSCHPGTRAARASHPNLFQTDLSLVTFFSTAWMQEVEQCRSNCRGRAKESNSPSGAINPIKLNRRASDTLLNQFNFN